MAQKFAIIILILALLLAGVGVFIYLSNSKTSLDKTSTDQPKIEKKSETAPTPTSTPKRIPTEAEITEYVTSTTKQINEEILTKPMTAEQLRFLRDPRNETVKRLSN